MSDKVPQAPKRPHVVIVGAGFGGLYAARALKKAPVDITIVDRRNHHLFQPLLYQVATAALNPADIAYPIRAALRRQQNVRVMLARAERIDVEARQIHMDQGVLTYDYLIIATGATHSYFGHDDWAENAPGLKNIEDALEIRRRILLAYEAAELEKNDAQRAAWLTFTVVGGGPTGVELAGALAEIAEHALQRDFRNFRPSDARILLLEGGPRVLPSYASDLSEKAKRQLERLGVEVRVDCMVRDVDGDGVLAGGEWIESKTVLWAAGVAASPLGRTLDAPLDRAGRVLVEADLSLPKHPEVFVVGDLAAARSGDKPVPGVAPAAIQGGKHAAACIMASLHQRPRRAFVYLDKGSLATIGRAAAVAELGFVHIGGLLAWLAWMFVHVFFLIGFRNKVFVLASWAWSYVTFRRGARLITGGQDRLSVPDQSKKSPKKRQSAG